jgi:hypothetical protein
LARKGRGLAASVHLRRAHRESLRRLKASDLNGSSCPKTDQADEVIKPVDGDSVLRRKGGPLPAVSLRV